ncbi:MAG: hypothetical protein KKH41_05360 [Candidatus Thermoplasmatota archaeon]|nr:hypothetical protein [Euryarchaeota archaeon]MBU4071047.1 hypothetical protein [Candidatus Thermoplasmatota archaeon]MBU4144116.1 hypothetical protein [Candidatus Thermoplasmatota archaeon]MBU4591995.1 hypothetical protein [Candidatus Thermoplasmatota archaeon]
MNWIKNAIHNAESEVGHDIPVKVVWKHNTKVERACQAVKPDIAQLHHALPESLLMISGGRGRDPVSEPGW